MFKHIQTYPILFTIVLFVHIPAYANDFTASQKINFVYIHGTNNNENYSKDFFVQQAKNLHLYVKSCFDKSQIIKTNLLENGKYIISDQPIPYYWGDKTGIKNIEENLDYIKTAFSICPLNWASPFVRKQTAKVMHDAIWFIQENNKQTIITELFKEIKGEPGDKDDSFILLGHSAGSLITFEFLKYRLPYFNVRATVLKAGTPVSKIKIDNRYKQTCLQALLKSKVIEYDEKGNPIVVDFNSVKNRLKDLDNLTKGFCIPEGNLKGVITFGSPIAVFFSSVKDKGSLERYFTEEMLKYFYNNNLFWLHINHRYDFIGVPFLKKDIQEILKYELVKNKTGKGFFVNNDTKWLGATIVGAHSWYWNKPKSFSKLILETYEDGYRNGSKDQSD